MLSLKIKLYIFAIRRMGPHKRGYETDLVAKAIVQGRGMV